LPFFWSEIATRGQLFGNTNKGSTARITNDRKFSYPGYNEIITGLYDPRITSNNKLPNPNVSVFEWLNRKPAFQGKVAVFASWDVFPYIFNCTRSGLPVWPEWEARFANKGIEPPALLQDLVKDSPSVWPAVTQDSFILHATLHHLKTKQPRVLFIGFGDTDEWAHERRYDHYLLAAHKVDEFTRRLWETVQSLPEYRDQTTFILTADHGRGDGPKWADHGAAIEGAEHIWLGVLGPDTPALGERANIPSIGQNQIAATLAKLLGEDYQAEVPKAGGPVGDVVGFGKR
jgi:hypothetical protein